MQEGGSNTLYLALGLQFRRKRSQLCD
ncbi:hypothetical protein [Burkholderia cepacia]